MTQSGLLPRDGCPQRALDYCTLTSVIVFNLHFFSYKRPLKVFNLIDGEELNIRVVFDL